MVTEEEFENYPMGVLISNFKIVYCDQTEWQDNIVNQNSPLNGNVEIEAIVNILPMA